ncbi:MAG: hypothetical protein HQL91_11080 [Magnetococcales bacterium]|nr:hypothetical protein [Magnetococcales bacterium]
MNPTCHPEQVFESVKKAQLLAYVYFAVTGQIDVSNKFVKKGISHGPR